MKTLNINFKITDMLEDYFLNNPDVRFHQALFNLGINEFKEQYPGERPILKDKYNEESEITLQTIKNNL